MSDDSKYLVVWVSRYTERNNPLKQLQIYSQNKSYPEPFEISMKFDLQKKTRF